MIIDFWGVRGSIPTPITDQQIKSKIQAVVQRISPKDLVSQDSRQAFLDKLPSWLNGTIGGNTSCVHLKNKNGTNIILDAGSGIRALGKKLVKNKENKFHIFFSHFHWDHIQGLPFFDPIFNPNAEIHFYSPKENLQTLLEDQSESPYFPVSMRAMTKKNMYFHILKDDTIEIDGTKISYKKMFHPGDSYSYSFEEDGKKFVYATDVELNELHINSQENQKFFLNSDVLILDSQYTDLEALEKANWGHSSFSYGIEFAISCNVKKLFFFHHEPMYDDKKLYTILQNAKMYSEYVDSSRLQIYLAKEGLSINI